MTPIVDLQAAAMPELYSAMPPNPQINVLYLAPGQEIISPEQLEASNPEMLATRGGSQLAKMSPSMLVKYAERTSILIPKLFAAYAYGPLDRDIGDFGSVYDTYIFMELIEGEDLGRSWGNCTSTEKEMISADLKKHITELRALPMPGYIGSVDEGPVTDIILEWSTPSKGPFKSVKEFNTTIADTFVAKSKSQVGPYIRGMLDAHKHKIVFTHGDLRPRNIVVRNGRVTAIIDWEMAGWYPEYWEFAKAFYLEAFAEDWASHLLDVLTPYYCEQLMYERLMVILIIGRLASLEELKVVAILCTFSTTAITMGNLIGCYVVLLLAPTGLLLFPVSVLVLVLERISKYLLLEHTYSDYRSGASMITLSGRNSTDDADIDVTMRIDSAPSIAILGVCAAAYIVCAIDAFGIWELKKIEGAHGHYRVWAWTAMISNVLLVALSLGVFGWATSLQSSSGWQSYDDVQRQNQEFTRETWACQIERFYQEEDWASAACGTAKATRFLLIPMAIFALLVIVSLWVLIRQRGGFKWLCGGKGRYAGFDNAYELQQSGTPLPYAQAPPQWVPQPAPQPYYVVQPTQRWGSPPVPQMSSQESKTTGTADERAVFR
ncbi:hypothetical protein OPT61_g6038 [Boeremia exigua]|uniref:Uncharacterized protein n=1 Tax=Boeremia exigua TaxID=749465 RepID=A0ACC2I861_9PLEO|nr:hypothetical protein OPT61_g6038 [Boeremia exigua]